MTEDLRFNHHQSDERDILGCSELESFIDFSKNGIGLPLMKEVRVGTQFFLRFGVGGI